MVQIAAAYVHMQGQGRHGTGIELCTRANMVRAQSPIGHGNERVSRPTTDHEPVQKICQFPTQRAPNVITNRSVAAVGTTVCLGIFPFPIRKRAGVLDTSGIRSFSST